jgi:peptidoglycan/xylan/chitin deacetylase (PgdA/CDA1 family)
MTNEKQPTFWPHGKKFGLCLTHDVDRVKKSYQYITHFVKTGRPYHFLSLFQKNEPYWNFEKIMEIENKHNVKSTFFFLNESGSASFFFPKEWKLYLGRYNMLDSHIVAIIQKLNDNGWEIGLHGSYNSYNNENMMILEKEALERIINNEVIGIRQHYLNLKIPETWKFQDKIGFRNEKYHPFTPFNDSSFLVIPLAIMDVLLFNCAKNIDDAWKKCEELIDIAEKNRGILTVLWHQRVFNEKEFPGWSLIYEKIIESCKEKNAWIATARDVTKWWMINHEVKKWARKGIII